MRVDSAVTICGVTRISDAACEILLNVYSARLFAPRIRKLLQQWNKLDANLRIRVEYSELHERSIQLQFWDEIGGKLSMEQVGRACMQCCVGSHVKQAISVHNFLLNKPANVSMLLAVVQAITTLLRQQHEYQHALRLACMALRAVLAHTESLDTQTQNLAFNLLELIEQNVEETARLFNLTSEYTRADDLAGTTSLTLFSQQAIPQMSCIHERSKDAVSLATLIRDIYVSMLHHGTLRLVQWKSSRHGVLYNTLTSMDEVLAVIRAE